MTDRDAKEALGWRAFFEDQLPEGNTLVAARVARQDLGRYHLLVPDGQLTGLLPGRTRIEVQSKAELPTVGDWVLCAPADASDPSTVVIEQTLARFSKFSRKEAGEKFEEQVVAANVDTVFIVTGLDQNFNPARIERYLVLAWNSGASPVIVLSKADATDRLDEQLEQVEAVAMGTTIHAVSALEEDGLAPLASYLEPGKTIALLGSSGVGKSTIINGLLGYDRFETGAVRDGDSKGRHTTTFREMCLVPQGGLLIDTPGMREIQMWADDGDLGGSFSDVETLASQCRFNDCRHESEPGCAVREAIDTGGLEAARLESFNKYQRELEHFAEKQDAGMRAEKTRERRRFSKLLRKRPDKRDA